MLTHFLSSLLLLFDPMLLPPFLPFVSKKKNKKPHSAPPPGMHAPSIQAGLAWHGVALAEANADRLRVINGTNGILLAKRDAGFALS